MGCCESRHTSDQTLDLQYRTMYKPSAPTGFYSTGRDYNKNLTRADYDNMKPIKRVNIQ